MPLQKKKDGTREFEFSLPWKKVHNHYLIHLQKAVKHAEIKGFRKGKAPLDVVEKNIDKSKLYSHTLEHILPEEYSKEIKKLDLKPIIEPRVTPITMEEGKPWKFKAETSEKPEVTLGSYKTYIKESLKKVKKPKKVEDQQKEDPRLKALFDTLLKNAKVEIAPILINKETNSALSKLVNQLEPLKITFDDYAKSLKKSREDLIEEYKQTSKTNLKLEFILDTLVAKETPTVTKKEIDDLKPGKNQRAYAKYVLQKRKVIDKLLKL